MKRIISVIVAVVVLLGLASTPASAAVVSIRGCEITADFDPFPFNGMAWSTSDNEAYHTPMMRAGACRHLYAQNMSVYNAPACMIAKVHTYNENQTIRVRGPWMRLP